MEKQITDLLNTINEPLGGLMVAILTITGIWFTFRTRGVQFRMFGEMFRLLFNSGDDPEVNGKKTKRVSSFEAFTVSLANTAYSVCSPASFSLSLSGSVDSVLVLTVNELLGWSI